MSNKQQNNTREGSDFIVYYIGYTMLPAGMKNYAFNQIIRSTLLEGVV